jgi:hypothetical protein
MENAKNSNKQTLVGTDGKVNIPPYQNAKAKPNTSYK